MQRLTRERIVHEAIRLIDAEGAQVASMRKLAATLGVDPMAIYHHIPSRAVLLDEVAQTVLLELELPGAERGWRERIGDLCRAYRALAKSHPGVFPIVCLSRRWGAGDYRIYEAFLAALAACGMGDRHIVSVASAFLGYAAGYALDELNGALGPLEARDRRDMRKLDTGTYPMIHRLIDAIVQVDVDADFELGLDIMLNGLALAAPAEIGAKPFSKSTNSVTD